MQGLCAPRVKLERLEKQKALRNAQASLAILPRLVRLLDHMHCHCLVAALDAGMQVRSPSCVPPASSFLHCVFSATLLLFLCPPSASSCPLPESLAQQAALNEGYKRDNRSAGLESPAGGLRGAAGGR